MYLEDQYPNWRRRSYCETGIIYELSFGFSFNQIVFFSEIRFNFETFCLYLTVLAIFQCELDHWPSVDWKWNCYLDLCLNFKFVPKAVFSLSRSCFFFLLFLKYQTQQTAIDKFMVYELIKTSGIGAIKRRFKGKSCFMYLLSNERRF